MMPTPFMMPPPFPFIAPYAVPPPPMPPDLTNFTDEELNALEGNERKNIEERLKVRTASCIFRKNQLVFMFPFVAAAQHTTDA